MTKREGNDDKYGGWTKCSGEGNTNLEKECSKLGCWTGYSSVSVVGTLEGALVEIMSLDAILT
jgi:hypothetical protein